MTKNLSAKPVFPKTSFIVTLDYNRYAFDTIDQAARFVDAVSAATRVSTDYNAVDREDRALLLYKERVRTIATIEAVNVVIAEERTPEKVDPEVEEAA
jgi:hypothetical protein